MREHDVGGGEGRAVVEPHALAQPELPGGVVHCAPRLGEAGLDPAARVLHHQRVEYVRADVVVGREVVEVRIHGRYVAAEGDAEIGGRGIEREREERKSEDCLHVLSLERAGFMTLTAY
jgi:hypothetical protein